MADASRAKRVNHCAVTVSLSLEEYELLQEIHGRLRRLDVHANNSTPFRAGLRWLNSLGDDELSQIVRETPVIPRGPRRRD